MTDPLAALLHDPDLTGRAIHEDRWAMQVPSWGPDECDACQSIADALRAAGVTLAAPAEGLREAAQVIAKMDPWYQDPDDGWLCVFCASMPISGEKHNDDCAWLALRAALEADR